MWRRRREMCGGNVKERLVRHSGSNSHTVKIECGGMCERLKQAVLKTAVPERVPGVRIPLPPPQSLMCKFFSRAPSRKSRFPGKIKHSDPKRDRQRIAFVVGERIIEQFS